MTMLKASSITFYSDLDEKAFFDWINLISSVKKIEGKGEDINIYIDKDIFSDDLRELISLFYRYGVEMRQLNALLTAENNSWFNNEEMFWYDKIFKNL